MDDVFVGRHDHTLDAKGRVVLPAGFRPSFESSGFLIKGDDGCLALMTQSRFAELAQGVRTRSRVGEREHRSALRSWAAAAVRVVPDKQGRIAIPEDLRRYAQLERDCVVVGSLDQVEIWNAARWAEIDALGDSVIESPDEHRLDDVDTAEGNGAP